MTTMNPRKQARWAAVAAVAAAIATAVGLTVVATAGADASGQSYSVPCPAADQVTAALNTNLIANPGAEDVTSLTTLGAPSTDTVNVADCWTAGNLTQAAPYAVVEVNSYASYATASSDPGRGDNFFWGGTNENGATTSVTDTATQLITVGSLSAAGQPFELSGYLGGFSTQSDEMSVTATFEDVNGTALGPAAQIGPVTESQRGGVTELLHQAWYGTVPAGTAQILITLSQTGSGATDDGSADDLNLTIGASAVPSSPLLQKLPYTATGTDGGLRLPAGVSAANGTVYASNTSENLLATLQAGQTTAIAGSLEGYGEHGDGSTASSALLYQPAGTAEDANGDVFIADSGDNVVREITADGVIHRFAGTGTAGALLFGKATFSQLDHPDAVAVNAKGDVYIADTYNNRVLEVTPSGLITVVAGTGRPGYSGDGHPGIFASLDQPTGVAVDARGNLYIADAANNVIRRVDAKTGIITTVAGDYAADQPNDGLGGFSGDGGPATSAQLNDPQGVAVDGAGDLFIADTFNSAIREVTPAGVISTVVGVVGANGAAPTPGSESSGAAPTASHLSGPQAVAVDPSTDTLYIADTHNSAIAEVFGVAQSGSAAGPQETKADNR
jgi:sugar lactone lactonase YvrE